MRLESFALALLAASLVVGQVVVAYQAPSEADDYTPTVGQPGKDIVWVPTPEGLVERMMELAEVGPDDYVVDLGSGDGRTVIVAAQKFGARGLGIEYNPELVALSIRNADVAGVADRVEFVAADFFEADFSRATVVMLYLSPGLNLKLRPKILELDPGTRVVSHEWPMADWHPDQRIVFDDSNAYLWIVPIQVAGLWKLTLPGEEWTLTLEQEFQMLSGRLVSPDGSFEVMDGRVEGTEIRFAFIDAGGNRTEVSGRVLDDRMEGTLQRPDGASVDWRAVLSDQSSGL